MPGERRRPPLPPPGPVVDVCVDTTARVPSEPRAPTTGPAPDDVADGPRPDAATVRPARLRTLAAAGRAGHNALGEHTDAASGAPAPAPGATSADPPSESPGRCAGGSTGTGGVPHPDATAADVEVEIEVEQLEVLIRDSGAIDIRSTTAVRFRRLFGQVPLEAASECATLRFEEHHRSHDGRATVRSSLREPVELHFGPGALERVTITDAELAVPTPGARCIEGETVAQLRVGGSIRWRDVRADLPGPLPADGAVGGGDDDPTAGCDLFSFDALGFSDLVVTVRRPRGVPVGRGATASLDATVCLDEIRLHADRTTARAGSLFHGLPVQLGRLVRRDRTTRDGPRSLPVGLPGVPAAAPDRWYGVELRFPLAPVADVVGAVGVPATLLVGWGTRVGEHVVRLELPEGTGPDRQLSLLGLVDLRVRHAELRPDRGRWALVVRGCRVGASAGHGLDEEDLDLCLLGEPDVPRIGAVVVEADRWCAARWPSPDESILPA